MLRDFCLERLARPKEKEKTIVKTKVLIWIDITYTLCSEEEAAASAA